MIEVRAPASRHRDGFVKTRPVSVASEKSIGFIVFEENIFIVVHVASCLSVGHLLNAAAEAIVAVGARGRWRGIAGDKVLDLDQPILGVIGVDREIVRALVCLLRLIPIRIVLVRELGVFGELVARIVQTATARSVAHGIVGEGLAGGWQRMGGAGQPIQVVVAEGLRPAPIRQARPIADTVVDIARLVDLRTGGGDLMENVRHLRGGMVVGPFQLISPIISSIDHT